MEMTDVQFYLALGFVFVFGVIVACLIFGYIIKQMEKWFE